jgi:hypothetical protein
MDMTTFGDLVDWVEERLDPERGRQVAAEVAGDPELSAAVAWLRTFHDTAAWTPLAAPPAELRELLMRRFALYRPARPSLLERVQALLAYDSAVLGVAGVRGAAGTDRHLLFESPGLDIALDVYDEGRDQRRVAGQLLPEDQHVPAAAGVRLVRGETVVTAGPAEPTGAFELGSVPPGSYLVEVEWSGRLVVGDLDLA